MLAGFVLPGPWMTATQSPLAAAAHSPELCPIVGHGALRVFKQNSTVLRWLYAAVRAPLQEEVVCGVDVRQDDLLENSAELTN